MNPLAWPRFDYQRNWLYKGAFRVPTMASNGTTFDYNGSGLAYDPSTDSLFLTGRSNDRGQRTAELSIPTPVDSVVLNDLPRASFLQPFREPTEGLYEVIHAQAPGTPVYIGDYHVIGSDLFIACFSYYDGNSLQTLSHFKRPRDLSVTGKVLGPLGLTFAGAEAGHPDRFVNGYFCDVTASWQSLLGAEVIVGGEPANISGGASNGPDAFGWHPASFAKDQPVEPFLYYSQRHPLSPWNRQSDLWNGTTKTAGVALLDGFRAYLVLHRQGIGEHGYGTGYATKPIPPDVTDAMGRVVTHYCYDPAMGGIKGNHAYPYVYKLLAYDPVDWLAVKTHQVAPWIPRPYAQWTIDLPFATASHGLTGFAYDQKGQRLFISQAQGDDQRPVIHVVSIQGGTV